MNNICRNSEIVFLIFKENENIFFNIDDEMDSISSKNSGGLFAILLYKFLNEDKILHSV